MTGRGTSLAGIADAAGSLGFRTLVVRIPIEKLQHVTLPCIAYWQATHFVVIEDVSPRHITVADPNLGRVNYSKADFLAGWADVGHSGAVLLVEPGADQPQ